MRDDSGLYIVDLHVSDLKLLRDLRLSFVRSDGSPRLWTVLVGENGLGKTSLLRAIAIAAAGDERANQLADVASLPDRRRKRSEPHISAEFEVGSGTERRRLRSEVDLPHEVNLFRGWSRWLDDPISLDKPPPHPLREAQARRDPAPPWFVAGYGVDRRLPEPGNAPEPSDRFLSRLLPLFDRGPIIATDFTSHLSDRLALGYGKLLKGALIDSNLLPRISNLYLGGQGGVTRARTLIEANRFYLRVGGNSVAMPATWLSQGYQAMVAWIADLIGQLVLAHDQAIALDQMTGLVLVDEVDLFVHPRWQVNLVPNLKAIFPRLQFVVTTHSPMVLPGLDREEVFLLDQDDSGNITVSQATQSPKLLSGSEIYDLFFGIHELYPTEAARALRTFTFLSADPDRTDEEEQELRAAEAALREEGVEVEAPVARRGPS